MERLADAIARATILPVRHHSPAAAAAVARALRAARPRVVLIEGACDGNHLIPLLLAPDTRPPVAILAYRPAADGAEPRTVAEPFCDYSPELVALRVAAEVGAEARFFDAPAALWLADDRDKGEDAAAESLPDPAVPDLFAALAAECGFASHDEFWDCRFEMASPEGVAELIGAYGEMVRARFPGREAEALRNHHREAWMLREFARTLAEGRRPEEVAVVCGAAHVPGLRAGVIDEAAIAALEALPPARFALIPYSFPRLSEQLGYGAGNRAPAFYGELWRREGDWRAVGLDFLLRLMNLLRGRGYTVSLADAIEAQRLAENLAGLRDKPAPGLEEIRDAALACYGRGSLDPAEPLSALLIGDAVGAVSSLAAKTALQQEFLDGVKRHGIPFSDSPRDLRLNLAEPGGREASAFLHRLGVAAVPFARLGGTGRGQAGEDTPMEQLLVAREKWEVGWSPSTDIRLIALAPQGNTLNEVCRRIIRQSLALAPNLAVVAGLLRSVVMARLDELYPEVLAACERASGEDDDFSSLCRAAYLLETLLGYGEAVEQREVLGRLAERVFVRAALLLPGAAAVADEEVKQVADGLRALHGVAGSRARRGLGTEVFAERLGQTADGLAEAHAELSGLSNAILFLDGHLSDAGLSAALSLRLSRGEEPLRAAQFVEGLFSLNRSILVRNRAIVSSLSEFFVALDEPRFVAVLPVLRRSLSGLNRHELSYMVEAVAAALGLDRKTVGTATANPPAESLDDLAALDKEMEDLFG